ncbi:MAG: hypothetical protein HY552_05060 [Elusimicrobia bacterium]|nr:hypothetical protein [Elusimicrobiota bacterium]
MTALLLALALVPAGARDWTRPVGGRKPYGVLVLGYGLSSNWRSQEPSLRAALKTVPVETVDAEYRGAADGTAIQRALDRLAGRGPAKIVAVPLETVSGSPRLEQTRYLFGLRAEPIADVPDPGRREPAGPRPPRPPRLVLPPETPGPRRLRSRVPLVLAEELAAAPALVEILAGRARALSRNPARDAVVLAGVAPRSDAALTGWLAAARATAEQVRARGGFREAAAVGVRDGVRPAQRSRDADALRAAVRTLAARGGVVIVPLDADGARTERLLRRALPDAIYRWDGRGAVGDRRLAEWIKSAAAAAAARPDERRRE